MIKGLLCILALTVAVQAKQDTASDVGHFIHGFARGALNEDIPALLNCFDDAQELFNEINIIVKDLENHDAAHIIDAVAHLGNLFQQIPKYINDCQGVPQQTKDTFKKLADTFSNPGKVATQVAKALLFNAKKIWNDANAAVSDFKNHNYDNAGYDVGDIVKIIFLKRR